jgi:hypothetical protein
MRSFVACGMESATLDRLMKRNSGGRKSQVLRQFFQAHDRGAGAACSLAGWFRLLGSHAAQSRTMKWRGQAKFFCLLLFVLLTSSTKTYFIQTANDLLTRFSSVKNRICEVLTHVVYRAMHRLACFTNWRAEIGPREELMGSNGMCAALCSALCGSEQFVANGAGSDFDFDCC